MTAGGNDLPKENEPADPIAAAISRVKKLRALELELEAELGSDILALARDPRYAKCERDLAAALRDYQRALRGAKRR